MELYNKKEKGHGGVKSDFLVVLSGDKDGVKRVQSRVSPSAAGHRSRLKREIVTSSHLTGLIYDRVVEGMFFRVYNVHKYYYLLEYI